MASVESNIDEVQAAIQALITSINFTMPGRDQSLGRDLVGVVAQGIADRTVAEQKSVSGSALKANEPVYAERKRDLYGVDQPLLRTGQMLSMTSLVGETEITEASITMQYGTGEAPSSSSTGYISNADKRVTDREKASHVSDERPFYELDETIADAVIEAASHILDAYIESK